jgi:YgiT-type zinc finger domain-containing protein
MTDAAHTPPDPVRRALTAWQATHPDATFAEIEVAVEEQLRLLRAQRLSDYAGTVRHEERPACPRCGTTMVPRRRGRRTVLTQGEEPVQLERSQVVCPACGETLFPPR